MVNINMSIVDKVVGKIKGSADKLPNVQEVIPPKKRIKSEPELSKAEKSYSMAKLAYKNKDYRSAMMYSKDTIIHNRKLSGPYLIIADCYMDNQMYLNALRVVNKGIESTGGFELYQKIEEIYEAQGKRKKIRKMWDNYIMSSRKKDLGYKALGLFYEEKEKNPELAIQHYKKTLEANPVHIDIYERLATLYFRTDQMQEAINTYDELLFSRHAKEFFRNSTNKARVLSRVGEIYFLKRQFDFAFKYFDMALQAVPGSKQVYNRLGDIAYYIQDKKNTLKYYKLAYQCDETDIEYIIKYAISDIMNDKASDALPLFKRIQRYNPLITGIKQIVESLEEKGEIDDKYFRILVEENTDLLLDYRYEKDFKFPESRDELDAFRKKYNSIDAKLDFDDEDEAPYKKQGTGNNNEKLTMKNEELLKTDDGLQMTDEPQEQKVENQNQNSQLDPKNSSQSEVNGSGTASIEEDNGEKIIRLKDKLSKKEEERQKKMKDFGLQMTEEQTIDDGQQTLDGKTVEQETGNNNEKLTMKNEELLKTIDNSQSGSEKSPKTTDHSPPTASIESMSTREVQELLKQIQELVENIQGISQRILQINNIMPQGEIPDDNLKKNIVRIALENIEAGLQEQDLESVKEGISKLKKIL